MDRAIEYVSRCICPPGCGDLYLTVTLHRASVCVDFSTRYRYKPFAYFDQKPFRGCMLQSFVMESLRRNVQTTNTYLDKALLECCLLSMLEIGLC